MASLSELIQQKRALEARIAAAKKTKLASVIKQIKALVEEFELAPSDIFSGVRTGVAKRGAGKRAGAKTGGGTRAAKVAASKRGRKSGGKKSAGKDGRRGKVAPKYRDPDTGATWTGRGIAPKWIAGKDRERYLISSK